MTGGRFRVLVCCFFCILPGLMSRAQIRNDAFLHISPTDSLDATYYIPSTPSPVNGFPALMFVHGFALDKNWDTLNCAVYARSGYLTLCYSVRGHGNSSGYSSIMSGVERMDLRAVVQFLRSLPQVDTNAIGLIGGSQGGLHGLWAAEDGLPVNALSCDVIIPSWASDMLTNGSIRSQLAYLLSAPTVQYAPIRDTLWEFLRNDMIDSLRTRFAAPRDVDTVHLHESTTPMMTFLKWQDHYFGAGDGITSFLQQRSPGKLYLGTGGHFSDFVDSENQFQFDQITRWFNYWLRGIHTGILNEPSVTVAFSSLPVDISGRFTWARQYYYQWPPIGIQTVRLYFCADSSLSVSQGTSDRDSFLIQNRYTDTTYTFDTGYIEGFKGARFESVVPRSVSVFRTTPLPSDVLWIGTPSMTLSVYSDSSAFPVHALIEEEDTQGKRHFINRIDNTIRNWQPGSSGVVNVSGIAHAHRFTAGNRIVVELTNLDQPDRSFQPFVLPLLRDGDALVYSDIDRPSFIELPLSGSVSSALAGRTLLPLRPMLYQNHPNPFNPQTTISFDLPTGGHVSLEIVDILGQRIDHLIEEDLPSGKHEIYWNGTKFASGIYFYRLRVRDALLTRKMTLIR